MQRFAGKIRVMSGFQNKKMEAEHIERSKCLRFQVSHRFPSIFPLATPNIQSVISFNCANRLFLDLEGFFRRFCIMHGKIPAITWGNLRNAFAICAATANQLLCSQCSNYFSLVRSGRPIQMFPAAFVHSNSAMFGWPPLKIIIRSSGFFLIFSTHGSYAPCA